MISFLKWNFGFIICLFIAISIATIISLFLLSLLYVNDTVVQGLRTTTNGVMVIKDYVTQVLLVHGFRS